MTKPHKDFTCPKCFVFFFVKREIDSGHFCVILIYANINNNTSEAVRIGEFLASKTILNDIIAYSNYFTNTIKMLIYRKYKIK